MIAADCCPVRRSLCGTDVPAWLLSDFQVVLARAAPTSDSVERFVRTLGRLDPDGVSAGDVASCQNDGHDPSLTDQALVEIAVGDSLQQPWPEGVDLHTRATKSGHLEHDGRAEVQPCAARQPEQVQALRRDVLPELTRTNIEALGAQLLKQLGVHQVHLAEVGLRRIGGYAGAVLHGHPSVGVSDDANPTLQCDEVLGDLTEAVITVAVNGDDGRAHPLIMAEVRRPPSEFRLPNLARDVAKAPAQAVSYR